MANTKKARILLMLFCDFCGLKHGECDVLIQGRDDVHICSACVAVCIEMLADNKATGDRQMTQPTDPVGREGRADAPSTLGQRLRGLAASWKPRGAQPSRLELFTTLEEAAAELARLTQERAELHAERTRLTIERDSLNASVGALNASVGHALDRMQEAQARCASLAAALKAILLLLDSVADDPNIKARLREVAEAALATCGVTAAQEGTMNNRREQLAALCHEQWSGWMKHLFSKSTYPNPTGALIPGEWVERWLRQMNTPYADLSEVEKESDRKEANKFLAAQAAQWQPIATAPRDGRTLLVFKHTSPCWSIVGLAFWFGGENDSIRGWMSYGIPRLDQEPNTLGLAHPTHWMALPDPPAPPEAEA